MPDTPLGYVFIYFYGLERRLLIDFKQGLVSDEECKNICLEIERLKSIYDSKSYSFQNYSSNLLDYISIIAPHIYQVPNEQIEGSIYSDLFKVRLAHIAQNNEPLPVELACKWILHHPEYSLRTPARRCAKEFKALFALKYKEAYSEGLVLKPNKTKLRLSYHPASPSLSQQRLEDTGLCDLTVLSAPVKKLAKIGLECSNELDA